MIRDVLGRAVEELRHGSLSKPKRFILKKHINIHVSIIRNIEYYFAFLYFKIILVHH